jgi:septum formation protein
LLEPLLILASASAIRSKMLSDAGVEHRCIPSNVDEDRVKATLDDAGAIATELAKAKALDISGREAGDWVIGSDSVISVGSQILAKPRDREQAAEHLRLYSGKSITLTSSVALARSGAVDWSFTDQATLQVREMSGSFIDSYLADEWPEVGYCVGVFRMEARGVQLFDSVEGSHFTILGMPLIPLLGALRERGLLLS